MFVARNVEDQIRWCREQVRAVVERKLAEFAARGESHPRWVFEWIFDLPGGEYEAELFAASLPRDAFASADLGPIKIRPYSVADLVEQICIDRESWRDCWMDFSQEQEDDFARAVEMIGRMSKAQRAKVLEVIDAEPQTAAS